MKTQIVWSENDFITLSMLVRHILQQNFMRVEYINGEHIQQTDDIMEYVCMCQPKSQLLSKIPQGITALTQDWHLEVVIETRNKLVPEVIELLIHEFIHVHDYQVFAEEFANGSLCHIVDNDLFDIFFAYSEFHAYGYTILYTPMVIDIMQGSNTTDMFYKTITSYLMDDFYCLAEDCQAISSWNAHDVFQLLGKLYVVDKCFEYDIEHSCIYQYLPLIFQEDEIVNILCDIYKVCCQLLHETNIHTWLVMLKCLVTKTGL